MARTNVGRLVATPVPHVVRNDEVLLAELDELLHQVPHGGVVVCQVEGC